MIYQRVLVAEINRRSTTATYTTASGSVPEGSTSVMDDSARDEEAGLPGGRGAARQRSSIPSFLFISFMLFMLTSHNGDEFLARHQYQDALRSLTYQLSNYTDEWNSLKLYPSKQPSIFVHRGVLI